MRLKSLLELKKYKKPDAEDTLGVKRADMPQVKSSDYPALMKHLEDNGARFTTEKDVPAKDLKPVQSEFSDMGITKQRAKKGPRKPVIASSDNYIIDGHHRWLVALNYDETVDVIRVNMTVHELLKLVKEFPQTYYKDIYNEGYKLQLERDPKMYVLHIIDTDTGKRTEVRGKSGYESGNYDPSDKLHQLLDKIGKAANISELINGEPVGINPNHPDGERAKKDTTQAFNEDKDYMHGYCHEWALLDVKKNPERVLYARTGFHYDDEYEEVDHVFTVDPKTGKAYDVRGEFANADALLADHDFGADEIDVVQIDAGDIRDWISDGELKPISIDEDTPLAWIKRKYSKAAHAPQYTKAAELLHKILQRKHDETDGKLRHSLGYYAHMLSRQHLNIDWRELEAEYLERYGNELFEQDLETMFTPASDAYKGEWVRAQQLLDQWLSNGEIKKQDYDELTALIQIKQARAEEIDTREFIRNMAALRTVKDMQDISESALNDMILKIASALADDMTTAQQQSARAYDANKKRERVLAKLLKKRSKRTIQAIYKKLFGKEPV